MGWGDGDVKFSWDDFVRSVPSLNANALLSEYDRRMRKERKSLKDDREIDALRREMLKRMEARP